MRAAILITLLLLVAAAVFPPVDWVIPAQPAIGPIGAEPEQRRNAGFMFIGSLESNHAIRMSQWLVHLGVVAALGTGLALATSKRGR